MEDLIILYDKLTILPFIIFISTLSHYRCVVVGIQYDVDGTTMSTNMEMKMKRNRNSKIRKWNAMQWDRMEWNGINLIWIQFNSIQLKWKQDENENETKRKWLLYNYFSFNEFISLPLLIRCCVLVYFNNPNKLIFPPYPMIDIATAIQTQKVVINSLMTTFLSASDYYY